MKTITIRLPDVEAAMLVEVQKKNKEFRDLRRVLIGLIVKEYQQIYCGGAPIAFR